jgi:hypothetical protein
MEYAYTIEEERVIAERADLVVRGLTLGAVTDGEAITVLRAARLCVTRTSPIVSAGINGARRDVAIASLRLIEALKKNSPRDRNIELMLKAVEAWNLELAAL